MPFGQVVIGPPGSGKSTYCHGLQQFHSALARPLILVNLDPAAPSPPYPSSLSITDLITLDDAMNTHKLGPNGAMLYCLEYLEINFQWLLDELDRVLAEGGWTGDKREEVFVVFDTPGQVELSTDHGSLKRIIERLGKEGGWRLAAVHLMDASHILDPSKYVAILLLSLRTMLQLELPHINVLSKIDLLQQSAGDLPFNLDFYTEVQDLTRLLPLLESKSIRGNKKFTEMNRLICEIVEEFGLVSFETLCVEDKDSMMRLVEVIDQALGYVPPTAFHTASASTPHSHSHTHSTAHNPSSLYHTTTVQEKWIDNPAEYATFEREAWKAEGEKALEVANEASLKEAREREVGTKD